MIDRPTLTKMLAAARLMGAALGEAKVTYRFEGRFSLALAADWTLLLSPDDAGRIRVSACHRGRPRGTMWSRSDDLVRLVALARSAQSEARDLVA